jgi:hypothetical protein
VGRIHDYEIGASLTVDGDVVASEISRDRVLSHLMSELNQRAVEATTDHLLLHAGAVAAGNRAILLPAPMESGKTTLTVGLIQRGLDYVTDEAVAIDADSLRLLPYPKPLSIDQGSWEVLAHLEPQLPEHLKQLHAFQWQVAPEDIRPGCIAGPCSPALIVAPKYDPDHPTRLEPIGRAEAVVLLAENSFNFRDDGRRWLPVIGAVVERCESYRLSIHDLDSACEAVLDLVHMHAGAVAG